MYTSISQRPPALSVRGALMEAAMLPDAILGITVERCLLRL